MIRLPNLASPEAPAGGEDDYVVLEHDRQRRATSRPRDSSPSTTSSSASVLGAIDIERGAKVSGARFYYLTGVGAMLELALVQLAMERAQAAGLHADDSARAGQAARDGGHRLPRPGGAATSTTCPTTTSTSSARRRCPWRPTTPTRSSTPTRLPRRYAAFSPCYRKEAGSYGKDTEGIFRVHWFDKVELFAYTTLEESYAEHQRIAAVGEGVARACSSCRSA